MTDCARCTLNPTAHNDGWYNIATICWVWQRCQIRLLVPTAPDDRQTANKICSTPRKTDLHVANTRRQLNHTIYVKISTCLIAFLRRKQSKLLPVLWKILFPRAKPWDTDFYLRERRALCHRSYVSLGGFSGWWSMFTRRLIMSCSVSMATGVQFRYRNVSVSFTQFNLLCTLFDIIFCWSFSHCIKYLYDLQ